MAESIEQLHIYTLARSLEDQIYELVKAFPSEEFYRLGNDLRRSSAAVSHHIMGAHRLYSFRLKLDELAGMRLEAEKTQRYLESAKKFSPLAEGLMNEYTSLIKQSWGFTKWLNRKVKEQQEKAEVAAKEQMAGATV